MVGPHLKGLQSCLLMPEFSTCDRFSFVSQAAGLLFSCGDGLRQLMNVGIFWNQEPLEAMLSLTCGMTPISYCQLNGTDWFLKGNQSKMN